MDILNLLVGLLMIGTGFLVKSSPNMIAGYNTMSKDKKKNVDIEGLSTFMRNGLIPAKAILTNDTIRFSGMYGVEMKMANICNIELTDNIPAIIIKTNGFSLGPVFKGNFNLDKFGKCKLFLNTDKGPYLIISETNGNKTIINNKDKNVTKEIYSMINSMIDKQN